MNAVDETLLPPEKNIEGRPEVVYHGTLTKTYGLHLLIDAFSSAAARQEDLRLMIYGDGDERSALMHQADGLGIGDRVKFSAGYLPQRAALAAVAGAAVGVIPNLPTPLNRYALSSKLFEYVALGIPAVCADLPTLRAHFSEDEVVFFRPGCARSLADGLIATLGDPDAARSRAERARARYVEQYSWSSSAATYLSLLDEMQRSG
jgi:glycosyltransferase involved in cell wall biosynthesis